jgi:hypothetical protein
MITGKTSSIIVPMHKKLEDMYLSEEISVENVVKQNIVIMFLNFDLFSFSKFGKILNVRKNINKLKLKRVGN